MSDADIEQIEGEYFPHRALWVEVRNLVDLSEELQRGAAYSSAMGALVLMWCVVEGFANFGIEKLRPDIWKQERSFFSGGEFPGTLGKLEFIAQQVGFAIEKGARPYQTLRELNRRRNWLAHNRIDAYSHEVPLSDTSIFTHQSEYVRVAEPGFVSRAREDVERFCDSLQEKAYAASGIYDFKGPALNSYVGQASGTIKRSKSAV